MKILFVTSEAFPLMKTGGLGDVAGALPPALQALGSDVRLLMPAYRDAKAQAGKLTPLAQLTVPWCQVPVTLLEGTLPGTSVPVWLVDVEPAFDRPGNPYHDERGQPWPDNAARFALLARTAAALALGEVNGLRWRPDIVHCHDWQAGLVPALLAEEDRRPATIFTIHNLAYQGLFPNTALTELDLPASWWSPEALEFYDQISFIKGGLVFADWVTTVSPTYAKEIQTPEFGHGLDGLLRHRAERLVGILNGIDDEVWDPARDTHLPAQYSAQQLDNKRANKIALQKEFGLAVDANAFLIGMVGRLVHQKGMDLLLDALPDLIKDKMQLAAIGTGQAELEQALINDTKLYPRQCGAIIGYDEGMAHRITAGADVFLMPSRFEPCGLSQMYSQRYGTIPVVHRVGGLADTVTDGRTGIAFEGADTKTLLQTLRRAQTLFHQPQSWRALMLEGMGLDHSWRHRAEEYQVLYRRAIQDH